MADLFPTYDDTAIFFSRSDEESKLGSYILAEFELDDCLWPSLEHYFQAMKFENEIVRAKIRATNTAKQAKRLGRKRGQGLRSDWRELKRVMMTRGAYIRARTHNDFAQALLETGTADLVENNNYDYFWGCGRDRRGENHYGKVLMDVRNKLKQEQQA